MTTKSTMRFKRRGLIGVALIVLGVGLALTFEKTSDWPAEVKTLASVTAYCALFVGTTLSSSYRYQLEFKQMKISLVIGALLTVLLILDL